MEVVEEEGPLSLELEEGENNIFLRDGRIFFLPSFSLLIVRLIAELGESNRLRVEEDIHSEKDRVLLFVLVLLLSLILLLLLFSLLVSIISLLLSARLLLLLLILVSSVDALLLCRSNPSLKEDKFSNQ